MSRWAMLTLLWCVFPAMAGETSPRTILEQAIAVYTKAQAATSRTERVAGFRQAERLFAHALSQGARSAELYTNLGNAALQSERLGPAILAYRRALALDPNAPRARQNLLHARSLLPAWVPRPEQQGVFESFFFWRTVLSPAEQAGIAALSFLLAALLIAVAIRWRSTLARTLAIMPLLVWAGLLVSVMIETRANRLGQAVLIADETTARAADSPNAPIRFTEPLPGGTEVNIREARPHWLHIALIDGRDAWVSRGAVEDIERGL